MLAVSMARAMHVLEILEALLFVMDKLLESLVLVLGADVLVFLASMSTFLSLTVSQFS